jgi:hypothetical protein
MGRRSVSPLNISVPIVDLKTGCPTPAFQGEWQSLFQNEDGTFETAAGAADLAAAALPNAAASGVLLGRASVGDGELEQLTLSRALDLIGSAARGDLLFRGASGWQRLPAGTSGQFLKTLGAGADPVAEVRSLNDALWFRLDPLAPQPLLRIVRHSPVLLGYTSI